MTTATATQFANDVLREAQRSLEPKREIVHSITVYPKIYKHNESAVCVVEGCRGFVQRRAWERQGKWRVRLAAWMNRHAPFNVDDRSGEQMEAI